MNTRVLAALLLACALAACGIDSTPQSSGATASSTPAPEENKDEKKAD
jgi:hypothetical protein